MPGLKMNLNCPRRLAVYAVFDVLDTMGAEYARSMVGDIQAKVKVLGKTSGYAFAVTELTSETSILHISRSFFIFLGNCMIIIISKK